MRGGGIFPGARPLDWRARVDVLRNRRVDDVAGWIGRVCAKRTDILGGVLVELSNLDGGQVVEAILRGCALREEEHDDADVKEAHGASFRAAGDCFLTFHRLERQAKEQNSRDHTFRRYLFSRENSWSDILTWSDSSNYESLLEKGIVGLRVVRRYKGIGEGAFDCAYSVYNGILLDVTDALNCTKK